MPLKPTDYSLLIPEMNDWNNGAGTDIDGYLTGIGRFDHAIAYLKLFWPDFTIHQGYILFSDFSEAGLKHWIESNATKEQIEWVLNHKHILDLFSTSDTGLPSREVLIHIGEKLKDAWQTKLRRDFPERDITVELYTESESLVDIQLSFYHSTRHNQSLERTAIAAVRPTSS